MMRSLLAALLAAVALVAAGCSSLNSQDETLGWSAQRIYGEAKDAMASRALLEERSLLEKLRGSPSRPWPRRRCVAPTSRAFVLGVERAAAGGDERYRGEKRSQ